MLAKSPHWSLRICRRGLFTLFTVSSLLLTVLIPPIKAGVDQDGSAPDQTPITPPAELISSRCSAYSAPPVPAAIRTFFVNADAGNDSRDGTTPSTAWRSLAKANNAASPGDLFLLRGTFREQWINPSASGTAADKITYRRESGYSAILDGGLYDGAVDLISRSHIVIDGIEIVNTVQSIRIAYDSHYNWLRNLYIHDAPSTAIKFRFGAHSNRLEDSVITNIGTAYDNDADAINLMDDADGNVIVRNFIGKASHAAYNDDVQGSSAGLNEGNVIAQNIFDNPWASNVILAGRSHSSLVECNIMRNATQESTVNYPRMGIQLDGDDNVIRYNYIYNNKNQGILVEGRVFAGSQEMFAEGNHVYNNTIVGNGTAGIMLAVQGASGYVKDNIFENNLLWNNGGYDGANGFTYDIVADHYSGNSSWTPGDPNGNIFRSNNVSTGPQIRFFLAISPSASANLVVNDVLDAPATFVQWIDNTSLDPRFSNAAGGDFSLAAGSPMIDSGRIIAGSTYQGSAPDRGAFESAPQSAPLSFEGDVAWGVTGDGQLLPNDISRIRDFAVGNAKPNDDHNEFQRADSAPLATKGDGMITAADVVQARRFVAGLDPKRVAGGPLGR